MDEVHIQDNKLEYAATLYLIVKVRSIMHGYPDFLKPQLDSIIGFHSLANDDWQLYLLNTFLVLMSVSVLQRSCVIRIFDWGVRSWGTCGTCLIL